jgi:hypothetical protein
MKPRLPFLDRLDALSFGALQPFVEPPSSIFVSMEEMEFARITMYREHSINALLACLLEDRTVGFDSMGPELYAVVPVNRDLDSREFFAGEDVVLATAPFGELDHGVQLAHVASCRGTVLFFR